MHNRLTVKNNKKLTTNKQRKVNIYTFSNLRCPCNHWQQNAGDRQRLCYSVSRVFWSVDLGVLWQPSIEKDVAYLSETDAHHNYNKKEPNNAEA